MRRSCTKRCLQSHMLPIRTDPTQCGNCWNRWKFFPQSFM